MKNTIQLRPHQDLAIDMCRQSIVSGLNRPMLAAPCSFGKTIVGMEFLKRAYELKGTKGIFVCDRIKLVEQSLETFDRAGIEVGVMQGKHERTNPSAPIQIASIQTLSRKSKMPEFGLAIVDEAHVHYKHTTDMMLAYDAVPFIALSATPFSKGLGKHYNNLLVPITTRELLDLDYLTPVRYFGGHSVDTSKVKSNGLRTGGSDYNLKALGQATEEDRTLTGDIIKNWLQHAEGRQTIAFSPSIKHSKWMVAKFNAAGIPACHIDGWVDPEERDLIYQAHDDGEFLILSCSRLLNTGYDAPQVSCLIDCYPTKSIIQYVQRAGRIMRKCEGKEDAIYLDHAGNVERHGFSEDIVPESLDSGENKFNEKSQVKEKKKATKSNCPQCYGVMMGPRCACGYEIPNYKEIITDVQELKELKPQARNRKTSGEDKQRVLGDLITYGKSRNYNSGWAKNKYKSYFGVWPNKITPNYHPEMGVDIKNFITSQNIRYAKRSL